jgi:hypothetical protein
MEARPGVERFLALLEAGQALPPDPREAGKTREDAAAFVARMERIVARYEAQHLKRAEWQVGTNGLLLCLPLAWLLQFTRLEPCLKQPCSPCLRGA